MSTGGSVRDIDLPRPHVPAPIAVVRDFVNTYDHEAGSDALATADGLAGYVVAEGLAPGGVTASAADLELARRLRENLRLALEQNHDLGAGALAGLDAVLAELDVRLAWTGSGAALRPRFGGVRGALAQVGIAAHEAAGEGLWHRLKICSFDECRWAYFDHSKNRSRQWCEYGCGNLVKTRAYRARRRAAATG